MGAMRETWKAAKKEALANQMKAYKNWVAAQKKRADLGDDSARAELLDDALGQVGMGDGLDLGTPMTFGANLGPLLDKIESTHAAVQAAWARLTVEDLIRNKKLNAIWKKHASANQALADYEFLTKASKMKAAAIYNTFIQSGADWELNIDSGLKKKWEKAAAAGDWSKADDLVKSTYRAIYGFTSSETFDEMKTHPATASAIRAALGGDKIPALIQKALKACTEYARQTQRYYRAYRNVKPDFWTPLNVALNDIVGQLQTIDDLYKKAA